VLPALGPLVVGHVLIASRDHGLNLASMGRDRLLEYQSLVARVRNQYAL